VGVNINNYKSNPIVGKVIGAAYAAFGDGVHLALYVSASLMLFAALLSLVTLREEPQTP
jgi:nucleoside permease NupC